MLPNSPSKSIIDNWSLERTAILLSEREVMKSLSPNDFHKCIAGLSSYINSLLLYEETSYIHNGFENAWQRFDWFTTNSLAYIEKIDPTVLGIDWHSEDAYKNSGIHNFLLMSNYYAADLFVSPERAKAVIDVSPQLPKDNFEQVLKHIDEKIKQTGQNIIFENIRVGIDKNFELPSIAQYVLSESSGYDDLFKVILQLKDSRKIVNIRNKIEDITSTTKGALKFQKDIDNLFAELSGDKRKPGIKFNLKIPVLCLQFTKEFSVGFFRRKQHLTFLKDLITARMESDKLSKDLKRIFLR